VPYVLGEPDLALPVKGGVVSVLGSAFDFGQILLNSPVFQKPEEYLKFCE
jgi:hypothetical protein